MKRIAIGILAHVDAGKTTLSEGLLYCAGAIRNLGRVDAQKLFLAAEKRAFYPTPHEIVSVFVFHTFSDSGRLFRKANTRVCQAVRDIRKQIPRKRQQNIKHLHGEHDLVVVCPQSIEIHLAHAVDTEDVFYHNRPRKYPRQPTDYEGNHGYQSVSPRMGTHHRALA